MFRQVANFVFLDKDIRKAVMIKHGIIGYRRSKGIYERKNKQKKENRIKYQFPVLINIVVFITMPFFHGNRPVLMVPVHIGE